MSKEISFSVGVLFINALLISFNVSFSIVSQSVLFSIVFSGILSLVTLAINTKKYFVIKNTGDFSFQRVVLLVSLGAVLAHFSVPMLLENLWAALITFLFLMMFTLLTGKTNKRVPSDEQKIWQVESLVGVCLPHNIKVLQYYNNKFEILAKCQFDFENFKAMYKDRITDITGEHLLKPRSMVGLWDLNTICEALDDYAVDKGAAKHGADDDLKNAAPRILVDHREDWVYLYCKKADKVRT